MFVFVISDPCRPHVVLFSAVTLNEIADHLAALGDDGLEVYASTDGYAVGLSPEERAELARLSDTPRHMP